MGDQAMPLREEDVQRIGDYIKPWIRELVDAAVPQPVFAGVGAQLLERMVRVEEELKAQRELMDQRFAAVDKRFEDLMAYSDKRFEAVDRRFDDVNKRFEAVDKRFDDMHESFKRTQWLIGLGFALVTAVVTVFGILG